MTSLYERSIKFRSVLNPISSGGLLRQMLLSIALAVISFYTIASPFTALAELPPEYYQPPFQLHELVPSYTLNQKIRYFEDKTGTLSIDEIRTDAFAKKMMRKEQGIISLGFTDSAVWIKLPVTYRGDKETATFWFEVQMALADHVQFFVVTGAGRIFTHYADY